MTTPRILSAAEFSKLEAALEWYSAPGNEYPQNAKVGLEILQSLPAAPQEGDALAKELVTKWLFSRDTGISSKCLAADFLGVELDQFDVCHPLDPSDLGRCIRLIAAVPEVRKSVDNIAVKYPHSHWGRAAKVWDAIAASMANEVGIAWTKGDNAPITYKLMKEAGL